MTPPAADWLDLLDWRRETADLYARVRALRATDPAGAHALWQQERHRMFAAHPQSPLPEEARATFQGLPVWPYDPAFVYTAAVRTDVTPERLVVQTSAGHDMPLERVGRVEVPAGTLDAYWIDVYGGGLFLPFKDATSGTQSYGGGRYLLDTVKGADLGSALGGELILDFNFAYHPSCFYDDRWSCPLAPPGNILGAAIRAGERAEL